MAKHAPSQWQNRIVATGDEDAHQLLANPFNARIHPRFQQDALEGVLNSVGWVQRVIVNKRTQHVVDGHLRVALAITRGERVPVDYVDLDEAEEKLILASFDYITSLAAYDREQVDALLRDVQTDEPALQELLAKLAVDVGLYKDPPSDPGAQLDRAAELQQKWQTARGQLWTIGQHRLLCGDSTNAEDVARLMAGEKATLMLTDPPYGVDYGQLVASRQNQKQGGWDDIHNDALSDESLQSLLEESLGGAGALVAFLWHPPGARRWLFWRAAEVNGWRVAQEIVWVKNALVFGRADYQWRHEPCLYLKRQGAPSQEDRTQTTVWEVNKPQNSTHPTQKPVELFTIPIQNHTTTGDIVFDPFGGSGTTMVAAEQLGRCCFMMELEPKYVAVILERMAGMGLEPQLVDTTDGTANETHTRRAAAHRAGN